MFEEFFLAPYNFDNAGFVSQTGLQFQANSEASCEAAAAKINDHADYSGAPTIECYDVSGRHLTPHLYAFISKIYHVW